MIRRNDHGSVNELNLLKTFVDATNEDFTHWGGLTDYGNNAFLKRDSIDPVPGIEEDPDDPD